MTHATHALAAEPSSHGFRGSAIVNRIDRARIYESIPYSLPLPEHLAGLLHQLANARTVEPDRIPPDLVTMNSVVRTLAPRTGRIEEHTLVYPYQADLLPMAASVAAPRGAAFFGRRVGDYAVWNSPRGKRVVLIDALIYQPEREGDYGT